MHRFYDPILFDPKNQGSFENAKACYDDLMSFSSTMGILPYRLSSSKMTEFFDQHKSSSMVKLVGKLKKLLDENEGAFSPALLSPRTVRYQNYY